MRTPFVRPCCSTVILRQGKMGCHQPRSCMATHYRTPSQSTGVHLHQSGSTRSRKQSNLPRLHKKLLPSTITRQPTTCHADITVGSHVQCSILRLNCGILMEWLHTLDPASNTMYRQEEIRSSYRIEDSYAEEFQHQSRHTRQCRSISQCHQEGLRVQGNQ